MASTDQLSNNYVSLQKAAIRGDWEAAKTIFEQDPAVIQNRCLTSIILQQAAESGNLHFLENLAQLLPDEALDNQNGLAGTALHVAVSVGNTAEATVLINRMPSLLNVENAYGDFPVTVAARYVQIDTLKYLISITSDHEEQLPYQGINGARLLDLVIAAEFFDVALYLVDKYPHTARLKLAYNVSHLETISQKKSVFASGLHFNFRERCIAYLLEYSPPTNRKCIERLVPTQTKIIKDKHLKSQQALELVKRLCEKMEESSSKDEAMEMYGNALEVAAEFGVPEVVEAIIDTFPYALAYHSDSYATVFHVAVESRSEDVFNLIYQMRNKNHVAAQVSNFYNSLLHMAGKLAPSHKLNAVSGAALQMQRELQWYKEVESFSPPHFKFRMNVANKSPSVIFTEEHKELKEAGEKWMKDTANSCTIAAGLIATVMFAAAITVPGGNNGETGFPMFSKDPAFLTFAVSDVISLFTSIASLLIFLSVLTSRYAEDDFLLVLPRRLIIGLTTLFVSITFMMAAFSATVILLFGRQEAWCLAAVTAMAGLPVSLFVMLQFPLLVELVYSTYGPGIFRKRSNRPFP